MREYQTPSQNESTTSDAQSPKSRKNSWLPTVIKNIACQSLGWCPPVASGTATRRPWRVRSQSGGVKAPPRRGPVVTEATAALLHTWQRHIKSHPKTCGSGKTDSLQSSLVSSQGVSSPTLPNGCGQELIGLSLQRDQGKVSDACRQRRQRGGADIAISPPLLDGSWGAFA